MVSLEIDYHEQTQNERRFDSQSDRDLPAACMPMQLVAGGSLAAERARELLSGRRKRLRNCSKNDVRMSSFDGRIPELSQRRTCEIVSSPIGTSLSIPCCLDEHDTSAVSFNEAAINNKRNEVFQRQAYPHQHAVRDRRRVQLQDNAAQAEIARRLARREGSLYRKHNKTDSPSVDDFIKRQEHQLDVIQDHVTIHSAPGIEHRATLR